MARAHRVGADGVELDLIGQPLHLRPGPAPGVTIEERGDMTKAPYDGKYLLDGHPFRMRAGEPLPEGAEPVARPGDVTPDAKAEPAAPENKAEPSPATKGKKG